MCGVWCGWTVLLYFNTIQIPHIKYVYEEILLSVFHSFPQLLQGTSLANDATM